MNEWNECKIFRVYKQKQKKKVYLLEILRVKKFCIQRFFSITVLTTEEVQCF